MRKNSLALFGLLMLALSIVSCGSEYMGTDNGVVDGQGPCETGFPMSGGSYPAHFLHWMPDDAHLIFNYGESIYVVDTEGTQVRELVNANPNYGTFLYGFYADVSPDSARVVYSTCEFTWLIAGKPTPKHDIAVINLDGTGQQRLTEEGPASNYPAWSPDGSHIAFIAPHFWGSNFTGYDPELYTMAADGSDIQQVVTVSKLEEGLDETKDISGVFAAPPVWSPNGERLAFLVGEGVKRVGSRWVLYTVRTDGTGLTRIAEAVVPPVWSPDGEYLTFARASEIDDESGEWEEVGERDKAIGVYTVRADGTEMRQLLAPPSAEWNVTQIAWSPDGSELLIVSEQQALIIQADGTGLRSFELPGHPEAWRQVAWSPDGSRVAVFVSSEFSNREPPQLYTVARDGTDRRDLIRMDDDGNLAPANPPEDE